MCDCVNESNKCLDWKNLLRAYEVKLFRFVLSHKHRLSCCDFAETLR